MFCLWLMLFVVVCVVVSGAFSFYVAAFLLLIWCG